MRISKEISALTVAGTVSGELEAIASKSHVHRLLMAAALADAPTRILCASSSADIEATMRVLTGLGAKFTVSDGAIVVSPITALTQGGTLNCGESGTTLRFMLPIVAALGADAGLVAEGRLVERPLSPLYEELVAHGIALSAAGSVPLSVKGKLTNGDYKVAANVSSQFVGGLLYALSILPGVSTLTLTETIESRHYISMTLDVLRAFGAQIETDEGLRHYRIVGRERLVTPRTVRAEGDWSNAAFWLCAGALKKEMTVSNLKGDSLQGDRALLDILARFGAEVSMQGVDTVRVKAAPLKAQTIDAQHIPDLVPVLAITAAFAQGETHFTHIARLRIKESDRVASTLALLGALGVKARSDEDNLWVMGGGARVQCAAISSFNDHRIVMAAAVAAHAAEVAVTITEPSAVNKSYPTFFEAWTALGGSLELPNVHCAQKDKE